MKTFAYTARDTTGATRSGTIQAPDRPTALRQLQQQKLAPITLRESKVGRTVPGEPPSTPTNYSLLFTTYKKHIALAILLLTLTLLLIHRYRPTTTNSIQYSVSSVQSSNLPDNLNTANLPEAKPPRSPHTPARHRSQAEADRTETDAHLNTEHSPLNTTALPETKPPRRRVTLGSRLTGTNAPPSGYHSSIDRSLNMFVNTRMGMVPPPLVIPPPGSDIGTMLEQTIHVFDTDTDEDLERKANVAEAKAALKKYLADGGTTEEFFQYYHDTLTAASEKRTTAHQEVMALVREGDLEAAQELMETKNIELEEAGIVPLRIPAHILPPQQ